MGGEKGDHIPPSCSTIRETSRNFLTAQKSWGKVYLPDRDAAVRVYDWERWSVLNSFVQDAFCF